MFFFYPLLRSQREMILSFSQKLSKNLNAPMNSCLRYFIRDNSRKNRPKSFLHWKGCFFSKNLCFQQPLRCYRNDLIYYTVIVRVPFGPLQCVAWGLSHSILRENIGHSTFFTRIIAFLFENLCFQQPLRS